MNASQNACHKPIIFIDFFGDGEFVLKGGGVRIPRFKEHLKCRYVNPDADANVGSQGYYTPKAHYCKNTFDK